MKYERKDYFKLKGAFKTFKKHCFEDAFKTMRECYMHGTYLENSYNNRNTEYVPTTSN